MSNMSKNSIDGIRIPGHKTMTSNQIANEDTLEYTKAVNTGNQTRLDDEVEGDNIPRGNVGTFNDLEEIYK